MIDDEFLAKASALKELVEGVRRIRAHIADLHHHVAEAQSELAKREREVALLAADLGASANRVAHASFVAPHGVVGVTGPSMRLTVNAQPIPSRALEKRADLDEYDLVVHARREVLDKEAQKDFLRAREAARLAGSSKYDQLYSLISSGHFDVGFAARALYGADDERARNKVHAGITHLRSRGLVARGDDGSLQLASQHSKAGPRLVENADREVNGGPAARTK